MRFEFGIIAKYPDMRHVHAVEYSYWIHGDGYMWCCPTDSPSVTATIRIDAIDARHTLRAGALPLEAYRFGQMLIAGDLVICDDAISGRGLGGWWRFRPGKAAVAPNGMSVASGDQHPPRVVALLRRLDAWWAEHPPVIDPRDAGIHYGKRLSAADFISARWIRLADQEADRLGLVHEYCPTRRAAGGQTFGDYVTTCTVPLTYLDVGQRRAEFMDGVGSVARLAA